MNQGKSGASDRETAWAGGPHCMSHTCHVPRSSLSFLERRSETLLLTPGLGEQETAWEEAVWPCEECMEFSSRHTWVQSWACHALVISLGKSLLGALSTDTDYPAGAVGSVCVCVCVGEAGSPLHAKHPAQRPSVWMGPKHEIPLWSPKNCSLMVGIQGNPF